MTLPRIVWKSLRQHALSSVVTALSAALAAALLLSVWTIKEESQKAFTGMSGGFDAVLGARSSKLQLVLNAIFHLEESPGNLELEDYLTIQTNPTVAAAVPIAMGDNYRGYRVVGTTKELFDIEHAPQKKFQVRAPGRFFDPTLREAVVGSFAAKQLRLKRGDEIHPYHGLTFNEKEEHAETYVVVGILEPSNTPADRVIWIPLEGLQKMSGHDPNAHTEISAVLVKFKAGNLIAGRQLDTRYNKEGERLTFVWPIAQTVSQLFDKIAWFDRVLQLVAYLVGLVAAFCILASMYNSMNERRREIAILRALGAKRSFIFLAVVLEATTISALGMILGFFLHAGAFWVAAAVIRDKTGVVLDLFAFHPVLIWGPIALIAAGALAGMIPALKAYNTDVAENLGPTS